MYPSKSNPYAGVFIKTQFEKLKESYGNDHEFHLFKMNYSANSKVITFFKYLTAFIRFIPELFKRYDIVHVHYFGYLAPLAAIYKFFHPYTKTFVTFHGSDINKDMPKSGLKNKFFRELIKNFNGVIAVGSSLELPLLEKLDVEPHKTLCAGIDRQKFYRVNEHQKLYDFVVVGSFVKVKGLDFFKEAVEHLNEPNIKICFVGHGPEKHIVEETKNFADVKIIDNLDQDSLRAVYNQSKFLVFPSRNDAFGLVVSESIYCGTPAIVGDSGGAEEQVIHGINGFVFDNSNAKELASMMGSALQILSCEYEQISDRCSSSNFQYSLEHVVESTMTMYSDAINNHRTIFKTSIA